MRATAGISAPVRGRSDAAGAGAGAGADGADAPGDGVRWPGGRRLSAGPPSGEELCAAADDGAARAAAASRGVTRLRGTMAANVENGAVGPFALPSADRAHAAHRVAPPP